MNRSLLLGVLVGVGAAVGFVAARSGPGSDVPSVGPLAELTGRAAQLVDRGVSQALGVDEADEAALGRELLAGRLWSGNPGRDQAYVRDVFADVATVAKKDLSYEVWMLNGADVNAHALPGGVVLVTEGLLQAVGGEDELACVLAHELGHIELSHGLDAAKYEIAARKLGAAPLGEVATAIHQALLDHAYSQAQEAEADRYAMERLLSSRWDPRGCERAFATLARGSPPPTRSLMREYLSSHPPIDHRRARAAASAASWWAQHRGEVRWRGVAALAAREALVNGVPPAEQPVVE